MSILLPLKAPICLPEPLWQAAPERAALPVTELHIWRARLDAPEPGAYRSKVMEADCPVARQGADRLKAALFKKDILERYTSESGDGSKIAALPGAGLRMAVAQCDHVALIAVSRDVRGVGLDVERVREDIPVEEMAGGFLDARAQWDLRVTWSAQEKAWKFFQFWTSNEACDQARHLTRSRDACHVQGFMPDAGFVAALALEGGPEARIIYWEWIG